MKKIYKTAKGRNFDMEKFVEQRGHTKAVGNASMNARGDILGKLNEVKITREQLNKHPSRNPQVETKLTSLKNTLIADSFDSPEETLAKIKTKRKETSDLDSVDSLQHRENKRKKLK